MRRDGGAEALVFGCSPYRHETVPQSLLICCGGVAKLNAASFESSLHSAHPQLRSDVSRLACGSTQPHTSVCPHAVRGKSAPLVTVKSVVPFKNADGSGGSNN
ncbi:unnamed protein product, partial [Iphiclides podalirius]